MPLDLRRLFEQALKVSLASPLLFTCGAGIDTRPFEPVACTDTGALAIDDLTPASPVDYVELRRIFMHGGTDPANESLLSTFGSKCANASSSTACESALTALKEQSGYGRQCLQFCTSYYLATQKADAVSSITTAEALKAFLGTIDTAQEAVLLASGQPINFACADKSKGAVRKTETGWEVIGYEGHACGAGNDVTQHVLAVGTDGSIRELSTSILEKGQPGCAIGRRPCGLQAVYAPAARDPLARHFVAAAHLEAASVPAFLRLRDELKAHGAPLHLALGAQVSAADEVRHARAVSALARRFGGTPVRPRVTPLPLRPLLEVARDNAVEGCVRETFGALVAHRQAMKAKDPEVRRELQAIAHDETRHAALSWSVHEWVTPKLSREERHHLRTAQREAISALRAESAEAVDPAVVEQAGMPAADEAVTLVDQLKATLWS